MTTILQTVIICMMLLRICALYERRVSILVLPVIISICSITIGIAKFVKSSKEIPAIPNRCDSGLSAHQAHYIAGAFGGEVVFDVVIFALTLYKVLALPRGNGSGLLTTIMRDGTVYFGVMTIFNLTNILTLVLADPINRAAMINPTNIISSIMMTRLMLNLRDPKLVGKGEEFKTTTINIRGFNRPTGTTINDSRNERSV